MPFFSWVICYNGAQLLLHLECHHWKIWGICFLSCYTSTDTCPWFCLLVTQPAVSPLWPFTESWPTLSQSDRHWIPRERSGRAKPSSMTPSSWASVSNCSKTSLAKSQIQPLLLARNQWKNKRAGEKFPHSQMGALASALHTPWLNWTSTKINSLYSVLRGRKYTWVNLSSEIETRKC